LRNRVIHKKAGLRGRADIPRVIVLCRLSEEKIDFKRLKGFVWENFAIKLEVRQNFPSLSKTAIKNLALKFSQCRVKDINNPLTRHQPLPLEIENEETYLKTGRANKSLVYDAIKLLSLFENLLAAEKLNYPQIVLADRLFGTFSADRRFHLRSIICGYPNLISIPGIIEAPARPREFYQIKNRLIGLGLWEQSCEEIKAEFKDRFIDYDDKRLTEVLKGFISQVLFFYLTGEPFCAKRDCRLFNSHWQEDLIYSQVKKGKFCPKHQAMVRLLKGECEHERKG
jgi:hypothetical protein